MNQSFTNVCKNFVKIQRLNYYTITTNANESVLRFSKVWSINVYLVLTKFFHANAFQGTRNGRLEKKFQTNKTECSNGLPKIIMMSQVIQLHRESK